MSTLRGLFFMLPSLLRHLLSYMSSLESTCEDVSGGSRILQRSREFCSPTQLFMHVHEPACTHNHRDNRSVSV